MCGSGVVLARDRAERGSMDAAGAAAADARSARAPVDAALHGRRPQVAGVRRLRRAPCRRATRRRQPLAASRAAARGAQLLRGRDLLAQLRQRTLPRRGAMPGREARPYICGAPACAAGDAAATGKQRVERARAHQGTLPLCPPAPRSAGYQTRTSPRECIRTSALRQSAGKERLVLRVDHEPHTGCADATAHMLTCRSSSLHCALKASSVGAAPRSISPSCWSRSLQHGYCLQSVLRP